jgi:hypothetical protein
VGNYIFSTAFVTGTATASSALSGFPASNATSYTRPQKCWKATGITTSTYLQYDFGALTTVAAIVIDDINVSSISIKGNAGGPWVSRSATMTQDLADGRYKHYAALNWTIQYLKIQADVAETLDDSSYMRIGSLVALTSVSEWVSNPSGEFIWQPTRFLAEQRFGGGGSDPVQLGPRGCIVGFAAPSMPYASLTNMLTVLGYDYGQPLVLYRNGSATHEVYICRRIGITPLEYLGPNRIRGGQMLFEECL